MRGIILAGGTGSRLGALTKAVNKHLLPILGVPMIYHPIRVLRDNGIDDITIVSSPDGVGQLAKLLGGGYTYRVQDKPGGIADALLSVKTRDTEPIAVILGDNVFVPSPRLYPTVLHCFLYRVSDNRQFGVPSFIGDIISAVTEKPEVPASEYAVTGLYQFSGHVWEMLETLSVGKRGEKELTDLLHIYADSKCLSHTVISGFWGDAGTLEGIKEIEACAF